MEDTFLTKCWQPVNKIFVQSIEKRYICDDCGCRSNPVRKKFIHLKLFLCI